MMSSRTQRNTTAINGFIFEMMRIKWKAAKRYTIKKIFTPCIKMILENELLKKKLIITREHSQTYRRVNMILFLGIIMS